MKKRILIHIVLLFFLIFNLNGLLSAQTIKKTLWYTSNGTFRLPVGIYNPDLFVWSGGGGGCTCGAGGGGAESSNKEYYNLTIDTGLYFTIEIGLGGAKGQDGGVSRIKIKPSPSSVPYTYVAADPGHTSVYDSAGRGGNTPFSPYIFYTGFHGGDGGEREMLAFAGAGGGGSAAMWVSGNYGTNAVASTAGTGGAGQPTAGAGGNGGNSNTDGQNGGFPGGGGGGDGLFAPHSVNSGRGGDGIAAVVIDSLVYGINSVMVPNACYGFPVEASISRNLSNMPSGGYYNIVYDINGPGGYDFVNQNATIYTPGSSINQSFTYYLDFKFTIPANKLQVTGNYQITIKRVESGTGPSGAAVSTLLTSNNVSNIFTVSSAPSPQINFPFTNVCSGDSLKMFVQNISLGNAVHFDGAVNNYIQDNSVTVNPALGFTIEGWYKHLGTGIHALASRCNSTIPAPFNVYTNGSAVVFSVGNGTSTAATLTTTNGVINNAGWFHIACVYDASGNGSMKIYVNGSLVTMMNGVPVGLLNATNGASFRIGNRADNQMAMYGDLDEIRIWNTVRTQSEILNNLGNTIVSNYIGLTAYFRLDESSGNSTYNSVTGNMSGTLSGSSIWRQIPSGSPIGIPYANYLWLPGNQNTPNISVTESNTYTVTVTDANGCSATTSATIVANISPEPVIRASGPTSFCSGASVNLNASSSAMWFYGIDEIVEDNSMSINPSLGFTVEGWIYASDIISHPINGLASRALNNIAAPFDIYLSGSAVKFYVGNGTVYSNVSTINGLIFGGAWNHIACVYDPASGGNMKIYVNGILQASGSVSSAVANAIGSKFRIGNRSDNVTVAYGSIDEVRVWNSVKTQAQIVAFMNKTVPVNSASLNGYYKFDEGTGTTTANSVTGLLSATLINGPTWQTPSPSPIGYSGFSWSPGSATTSSISATANTTYTVTVSNSNGCTATATKTITVWDPSLEVSTNGPTSICPGSFVELRALSSALIFDGINDYFIDTTFSLNPTSGFTIESWFKLNSIGTNTIISQTNNNLPAPFEIETQGDSLHFRIGNGINVQQVSVLNNLLSAGNWIHVACVYDNSSGGIIRIYLNGVLQLITTATLIPSNHVLSKLMIADRGDHASPANVLIDEVRIWNTVRTASQISANMNSKVSATSANLTGYYKLDEGSGIQCANSVNGLFKARLMNGPLWQTPSTSPLGKTYSSYLWAPSGGTNSMTFASSAGTYTVTATDAHGCSATASKTINMLQNPTAIISSSGPTAICSGDSVRLIVNPGGNGIQFSGSNRLVGQNDIIPVTGEYTVEIWAKQNGTLSAFSNFIAQGRNFYIGKDNNNIIRIGDNWSNTGVSFPSDLAWHHYAVVRTATNTYFYLDGILAATKGSSIPSPGVNGSDPHNLIVGAQWQSTQNAGFNGMVDELQIWNNARSASQIKMDRLSIYYSSTPGLSAYYPFDEGTGTSAYNIINNGNPALFENSPIWNLPSTSPLGGTMNNTFTWSNGVTGYANVVSSSGTYSVTATAPNGCSTVTNQSVTVNPLPPVYASVSPGSIICAGTSIILSGNGANNYTWSGGINNGVSFIPTTSTTYSVTGTNTSTGCSKTVPISITVNPLPVVGSIASPSSNICSGNSLTLNGTGASSYTWNGGVNNGVAFTPLNSATYTVTGIDYLTLCTNTATRTITVLPSPTVNASVNNANICNGTSVTLSGSGTNVNTFTWLPGSLNGSTVSATPSSTTTYTITGTNTSNGCTKTNTVQVNVYPIPEVRISSDKSNGLCNGDTVNLHAFGLGGNYLNFDGVNDYVQDNSFSFNPALGYTIEGKIKPNILGTNFIASRTFNNLPAPFDIYDQANGSLIFLSGNGSNFDLLATSPGVISSGIWSHIACVYDPSINNLKIYVNGILEASGVGLYASFVPGLPFRIGTRTDFFDFMNGAIDEVRIWNSVRSAAEINANMNGYVAENSPGLVASYHFEEGVGTQTLNSANVKQAILHNGPVWNTPYSQLYNFNNYSWTPAAANLPTITSTSAGTYSVTVSGANNCTASTSIVVPPCTLLLNVKVLLQGYYNSGSGGMNAVLQNQGISAALGSDCDTLTIELHEPTSPFTVIHTFRGVIGTDGIIHCNFPPAATGQPFYIGIKHRNTIETWSADTVNLQNGLLYDFSNDISKAYGDNQIAVSTAPIRWALFSGDINQDDNIDLLDASILEFSVNNFDYGYFATDVNGDGNVDLIDVPMVEENINLFIYSIKP